jgi:MFS superfamily sulfate permease-like transporter
MLGVFLILASILRLAKYISYVPQVVILGFMSGIAMLIWIDQFKVVFGLGGKVAPDGEVITNIVIALSTVLLIFLIPVILKKLKLPHNIRIFIPPTLSAIIIMTVITSLFNMNVGHIKLGSDGIAVCPSTFIIGISRFPAYSFDNGQHNERKIKLQQRAFRTGVIEYSFCYCNGNTRCTGNNPLGIAI